MSERLQLGIARFLQATLVVAGVVSFVRGSWTVLFASVIALFATFVPALLGRNFKLNIPVELHFTVTLFIYGTLFLGEVGNFYERFWWWDVVLHTGSAIVFGVVGFVILYTLHDSKRLIAMPYVVGLFTFAFAVAIGVLWEIFEFTADALFGLNMQGTGLVDTMWDLIVDSVGALFAAVIGYFYIKNKGKGKGYFSSMINKFLAANPQFQK